jgi:hypothetical protein
MDGDLVLRAMREDDLPRALEWDNHPEVHHFMQDDTTPLFTLEDLGDMYRDIAQTAYVLVIELAGCDIGTCWLQDMKVERLKQRLPGRALKRIDLLIGVPDLWGRSAALPTGCQSQSRSAPRCTTKLRVRSRSAWPTAPQEWPTFMREASYWTLSARVRPMVFRSRRMRGACHIAIPVATKAGRTTRRMAAWSLASTGTYR